MTALALIAQARSARRAGDLETAAARQSEAVALLREAPDEVALAHAVRHLADIHHEAGRHDLADPLYREVAELHAQLDVSELERANAIRSLALHAEHSGDPTEARKLWRDARERYVALTAVMEKMSGRPGNPGVAEADDKLARLSER